MSSDTNGYVGYKKNTVLVTRDGEVWARDASLAELVEVVYNVVLDRFIGRVRPGCIGRFTIRNVA